MKVSWVLAMIIVVLMVLALLSGNVRSSVSGAAGEVKNFFSAVINSPERSQLNDLQVRFLRNNMALQPHQTDYVYQVTDSFENVRTFYQMYCIDDDKNPYLFGNNLAKFCSDIVESKFMTNEE